MNIINAHAHEHQYRRNYKQQKKNKTIFSLEIYLPAVDQWHLTAKHFLFFLDGLVHLVCKTKRTYIEELFKNKQNSEMKEKGKSKISTYEKKRKKKSVWIIMPSKGHHLASTVVGIQY